MGKAKKNENKLEYTLQKNVKWLYENHFEGNYTRMEEQTGVNRKVISGLVRGEKEDVTSSTLFKFAQYGVNLNWLICDINQPFSVKKIRSKLTEKELLDNESSDIKKHVQKAKALLQDSPGLQLDEDVQSTLLEVLQLCVRAQK